jgi:hypothetical protein
MVGWTVNSQNQIYRRGAKLEQPERHRIVQALLNNVGLQFTSTMEAFVGKYPCLSAVSNHVGRSRHFCSTVWEDFLAGNFIKLLFKMNLTSASDIFLFDTFTD